MRNGEHLLFWNNPAHVTGGSPVTSKDNLLLQCTLRPIYPRPFVKHWIDPLLPHQAVKIKELASAQPERVTWSYTQLRLTSLTLYLGICNS